MDYLDHHSVLVDAEFLGKFGVGTRSRIADCILVIAQDLHNELPEAECALIAIGDESAHLVSDVKPDAHMLCVWRAEFERIARRMFPDDLAREVINTLFPHPSCP